MNDKPVVAEVVQPGTALAVTRLVIDLPAPIGDLIELTRCMADLAGRVNLLAPVAKVDHIFPLHKVALHAVMIDPGIEFSEKEDFRTGQKTQDRKSGRGKDVYFDSRFCKPNERALSKVALNRILNAAGVQTLSSVRVDDESDPYLCRWHVKLGYHNFDGKFIEAEATKEIDLRDGSPDTMKPEWDNKTKRQTGKLVPLSDTAIADKRRHIAANAETKAKLRCARDLFGLRHTFTVEELNKPFIIPVLIVDPNPDHPMDRAFLLGMTERRGSQLYGAPQAPQLPAPTNGNDVQRVGLVNGERVHVQTVPAGPGEPGLDEEPPDETDEAEPPESVDTEVPDLTPPTPATAAAFPQFFCACLCGDQKEISEAQYKLSSEKLGGPRCIACFPSSTFSFGQHKDLNPEKDLKLPKYPGTTIASLRAALERQRAAKAAKK